MLDGFDTAPDTPAEADGQQAGKGDGSIHEADHPAGEGLLVGRVEIRKDLLQVQMRDNQAAKQGHQGGDAEEDGDRSHDLVLLEADAAEKEIQEVAEGAHDGREHEACGRENDGRFSIEGTEHVHEIAVDAEETGGHGLPVGGIHQAQETVQEEIHREEKGRNDEDGHKDHGDTFLRCGSRDHEPGRTGLFLGQVAVRPGLIELQDQEGEQEDGKAGRDGRGRPGLGEHEAAQDPEDIEDDTGTADEDGGLGVVPPHLLEVVLEISPEALEVESLVHGLTCLQGC